MGHSGLRAARRAAPHRAGARPYRSLMPQRSPRGPTSTLIRMKPRVLTKSTIAQWRCETCHENGERSVGLKGRLRLPTRSWSGFVYRWLDRVEAAGDPASTYSERITAGDLDVRLTWSGLGEPFCFALPPDKSATGKHHMPSLFVGCQDASVTVNGRALSGKPVPREIAGRIPQQFARSDHCLDARFIRAGKFGSFLVE
jgi:hypothetical protein